MYNREDIAINLASDYNSYKQEFYKRREEIPYPHEMQEPTFEKFLNYKLTRDFGIFNPNKQSDKIDE